MKLLSIALILIGITTELIAQPKTEFVKINNIEWQKLAEVTVEVGEGGVAIPIYEQEKYGNIHFKVTDAQLELKTVEIIFENKEKQNVVLNDRLTAQQSSRNIDMIGGRRIIDSVKFTYKAIPRTDDAKATIQLWATTSTDPASGKVINNSGTTTTTRKKIIRKKKSRSNSKNSSRNKSGNN